MRLDVLAACQAPAMDELSFDSPVDPNHDPIGHAPVLLRPILELLEPQRGEVYLDCTLGRGGHALAIGRQIGSGGALIGLDLDPTNLDFARGRLDTAFQDQAGPTRHLVHANFAQAPAVLEQVGLTGGVNLLLADLGFASTQVDDPSRGLSFSQDGPLDMRLDPTAGQTAADLVNTLPARELADLIYRLGEERLSRRIAQKIDEFRRREPIKTTGQLAQLVRQAYGPGGRRQRIDPATRTFMALRIAVNGELESLEQLLADLPRLLRPGGKAGVISFHSLEDRLVKHTFRAYQQAGRAELVTRKPVTADEAEERDNPRSRSAKLRVLHWIGP